MNTNDVEIARCLAAMANANAWITMTAAAASRDIAQFGEWRVDYSQDASMFQADYEQAGRDLLAARERGR